MLAVLSHFSDLHSQVPDLILASLSFSRVKLQLITKIVPKILNTLLWKTLTSTLIVITCSVNQSKEMQMCSPTYLLMILDPSKLLTISATTLLSSVPATLTMRSSSVKLTIPSSTSARLPLAPRQTWTRLFTLPHCSLFVMMKCITQMSLFFTMLPQ